jgi:excisionase family DNA binding protein
MKKVKDKPYLTPNEVAEQLMVSPVTVRQWAQKGQLKAETTPGGHRRFLRSEVERFVREYKLPLQQSTADPLRILIVDDDEQLSRYLVELLSDLPKQPITETANDGFDAGTKVLTFQPHLMLLDLMMPDLNGFDVCRFIKQNPETKNIRIIAMTGYCSQENVDAITKAGAEECITKPINSSALLDAIGKQNVMPVA